MKYERRNCKGCGKGFTPKGKNQYGIQKFCSRKCKDKFRYEEQSKKKLSASRVNSAINEKQNKIKKKIDNIHQPLYNVKRSISIIKRLDKIHEDLVKNMNILKLNTYPEEVKNHCIYIMKESNRFLQNQLKLEKDEGVIIVQSEETT